jgi:hypothetical protein
MYCVNMYLYLMYAVGALTYELQAYNPEESIFGVVRLTFTWEDSGSITADIEVAGLPAAQYQVWISDHDNVNQETQNAAPIATS